MNMVCPTIYWDLIYNFSQAFLYKSPKHYKTLLYIQIFMLLHWVPNLRMCIMENLKHIKNEKNNKMDC